MRRRNSSESSGKTPNVGAEDAGDPSILKALARDAVRQPDECDEVTREELKFLRQALDRYDVLERLDRGGQGVIYKARQRGAKRIVAIKLLLDGPLATDRQRYRFDREIELISRLRHPNIVTLYDSGIVRGRRFFAMEFVDGRPIDDFAVLHDLPPREIVRLIVLVCRAVNYAHQNGVIHRDLNPANILVDKEGQPHVFDFGLAKDTRASAEQHRYSAAGLVVGTLPFISPEQAGGRDGVDVRTDVYALGVILYELLADRFPYPIDGSPETVRNAIISDEPMLLRKAVAQGDADRARGLDTINRDLEVVVAKALSKSKEERYQSPAEFADDLERYLSEEAISARAESGLYQLRKAIRKHRVAASVAAVIVLTLTVSSVAVTAALLQARSQRDRAHLAMNGTFDVLEVTLTEVDQSIRGLAGGMAVRERILKRLDQKLQRLDSLIESDPRMLPVLARMRERQGDVAHQRGQLDEADFYYRDFLGISTRLLSDDPSSASLRDSVARANRKLAETSPDPVPYFERGIEFAEQTLDCAPDRDDARYELCHLLVSYGDYLLIRGQSQQAVGHLDRGVAICPTNGEDRSENMRWSRIAAVAQTARGRSLIELGDGDAGIDAIKQGLDFRERIVKVYPADTVARFALMRSYRHVGSAKRDGGEIDSAKAMFRSAVEHGRHLAMMDPTAAEWNRSRFAVHHDLSLLCLDTGDIEAAREHCEAVLSLASPHDDGGQSDPNAETRVGLSLVLNGRVLLAEEALTEARRAFEQAASIQQRLLAEEPESLLRLEGAAEVQFWLGRSTRLAGDDWGAVPYYERSCQIHERIVRLQQNVPRSSLNLSGAWLSLSAAYGRLGTVEANAKARSSLDAATRALDMFKIGDRPTSYQREYRLQVARIRDNQAILDFREMADTKASDAP